MRTHLEAPRRSLAGAVVVVALGVGLVGALLAASDARAGAGDGAIGSFGSGSGELHQPHGVAVDRSNGTLYVADRVNERVAEFDPSGSFVRGYGFGVADGANEFQICTVSCQAGFAGAGAGQFDVPAGVAVDPSTHDVYVIDRQNRRVQKFDSEGNFILAFGGDVVSSGPGNTGGDEQQRVTVMATKGTFSLSPTTATGSGKLASGSNIVTEVFNTLGTFHVGDAITGTGVPANTTITAVGVDTLTLSTAATESRFSTLAARENTGATGTGKTTGGSNEITGLVTRTGEFAVGKTITGFGIPVGTTITAVAGDTLTLSASATATGANVVLTATDIPYNASAAELQAHLEALPGIGAGGVSVSGGPGDATGSTPYTITFSGSALQGNDIAQMTSSAAGLSEGTRTVAVATPVDGGGPEVCRAASGDVCKVGTTAGIANGQFSAWEAGAAGSFIDVGPAGVVYVGDQARVQEFEPDGTWRGNISLSASGRVITLAVDSAASVYLRIAGVSGVRKLELSGGSYVESPTQFDAGSTSVRGIALGAAGEVFVLDASGEYQVRQYAPNGAQTARFGDGVVEAPSEGMAFDEARGRLLVSNLNEGRVEILTVPPPGPLLLEGRGFLSAPTTTAMTVHATINPEGTPTTFHVEYGTTTAYGEATTESAPIGEGFDNQEVSVRLSGLQPGTLYHYRVVASNADGTATGSDQIFRTYVPGQLALPDGRAFELVSPADKEGAEVLSGGGVNVNLSESPLQASPDGGAIAYPSFTAFGEAQGAPAASRYVSRRGATGWSTENITPPNEEGYTRDGFRGFSPDLSRAAVIQREPLLAPGAAEGFENLYLRDDLTGFQAVTGAPRLASGQEQCVAFGAASAGFDRLLLYAEGALTPDAPEELGLTLYEWSEGDGLRLVSVLPDGTPTDARGFGSEAGLGCTHVSRPVLRHTISTDGSRIFWSKGGELFVREGGTRTVKLGDGKFWAASADGSRAFFSHGSLFEYDLPAGELNELVPGEGTQQEVFGVLGASDDGTHVYFVGGQGLAPGAAPRRNNLYLWREDPGSGESEAAFIATLSAADGGNWGERFSEQTARVTPDGRHLAFMSVSGLLGNSTADPVSGEPHSQVYLYDAQSDGLACVSCNPTGAAPVGPSTLPTWTTPSYQSRYLSDGGGRVFFESHDSLSLHDTNGRKDVYMWERQGVGSCTAASPAFSPTSGGCVFPITTGTSSDDSSLLDASADGRDVFIATRQQLVPADEDEDRDIYDARVGGGFPAAAPSLPCSGEACRPRQASPAALSPGSAAFAGAGNLRARRACGAASRRAQSLSRRAKRLAGNAKRVQSKARAMQMRRKASRLAKRAKRLSGQAKRCRRANRRSAR